MKNTRNQWVSWTISFWSIKNLRVKIHEEIITLKTILSKFIKGIDNLNKLLGYYRSSSNKSGNGYDGKVYVHDEDTIVCCFYEKNWTHEIQMQGSS